MRNGFQHQMGDSNKNWYKEANMQKWEYITIR